MSEFTCKSTFCVINNPRYDITYKHNEEGDIIKDENGKAVILKQEPTEYHSLTEQRYVMMFLISGSVMMISEQERFYSVCPPSVLNTYIVCLRVKRRSVRCLL